jgi:hypothetical protein
MEGSGALEVNSYRALADGITTPHLYNSDFHCNLKKFRLKYCKKEKRDRR